MDCYATGECFDDVGALVLYLVKRNDFEPESITVVHAEVLFDGSDEPAAHAWLEVKDECYETFYQQEGGGEKIVIRMPVADHNSRMKVLRELRYSLEECLAQCRRRGDTTGPWDEGLIKIASKFDNTKGLRIVK